MKQRALIIGVSDYNKLQQLNFCQNDGKSMYEALRHLGYDIPDRNKLIGKVDWVKMRKAMMDFFEDPTITHDDILIMYYSGHGVPTNDEVYLATSEIEPDSPHRNGIPFKDLTGMIQRTIANRVIIILDCCYSGWAKISKGNEDDAED